MQRITTLALVLLALGAVLIAYAETARPADAAKLAEPTGQVIRVDVLSEPLTGRGTS